MIQSKTGAQQDFKHLIHVRLYFHSREPLKKNPQSTKDHIAKFLTLSWLVVTKGHTYLNEAAAKSCRFV